MGLRRIGCPKGAGQLAELASGVDALYMSGRGELSPALLKDLETARTRAQESDRPEPIDLAGCIVRVEPRSWGRYRFRLQHEHGLIGVTDKASIPPVRIQPVSGYLHAVGPAQALTYFSDLAGSFTHRLQLGASRLDLYDDVQGWDLRAEDRWQFVTRADERNTYENTEALTGLVFGKRATKTIMARLYDKTRDCSLKGTDWWYDVWGDRLDQSCPVLRVEFEFGREGLKQFGIDTAAEALDAVGALWKNATSWLSHRTPTADTTRSRWPESDQWRQVRGASLASDAVGLERVHAGKQRGSMRRLLPALVGYLASAGAHLGTEDVGDTLAALPQYITDYSLVSRKTFAERIVAKRRLLGLT